MKPFYSLICITFIIFGSAACANTTPIQAADTATITPTLTPLPPTPTLTPTAEILPTSTPTLELPVPSLIPEQTPEDKGLPKDAIVYSYKIIRRIQHDANAFTQGLVYYDDFLFESTGRYGHSSLRKINLHTELVEQIRQLPPEYFGEGLALVDDKLVQLTWKSNIAFIYDLVSFDKIGEFSYPTEGWGLTHDGMHFIMSDGSHLIRFRDTVSFEETKTLFVNENDLPIFNINELEYVNGKIYANIWKKMQIAIIEPKDGTVTGWIDLSGIIQQEFPGVENIDHLNGIAFDEENDRLFITGKYWPAIFEIDLIEKVE